MYKQHQSMADLFKDHFEQWKVKLNLEALKKDQTKQRVAILCSGCYCPPHLGHYSMMEYAIKFFKKNNVEVVVGLFSVASDGYMSGKIRDVKIGFDERRQLLDNMIQDNNVNKFSIYTDDFEHNKRFIDYPELNKYYKDQFELYGVKLAYCIGSDLMKYGIDRTFNKFADFLVIIVRDQYFVPPDKQDGFNPNIFFINNTPTKSLNSTLIRSEIDKESKIINQPIPQVPKKPF